MTTRYPGGLIRKTPPTITPPVGGEGGSAPGVWTLEQASYYTKQGTWPKPVLLRYLYSWGKNSSGQLGQNDRVNRSSPVQVGSNTTWKTVSTGTVAEHAGAITTTGALYMWGLNGAGQLGLNDRVNRSSPVQVGSLTNWLTLSLGGDQISSAVKTDGTLWTWGNNGGGQLGDGTVIPRSSPVQIGALTNWSNVVCCFQNMLAIKTDGTLWGWGGNGFGNLGTNNTIEYSSPVQIGALTNWSKLAPFAYGGMAIKTDGTLWVWGYNGRGNLGINNRVDYSSPVQVGALTNWSSLGGGYFQAAAVKTDGTLWSWGDNDNGQLGLGDVVNRSSPVQVGALADWSLVSLDYKNCVAIKTDKTLWSWGRNSNGQLGQNDVVARSSPVQVGSGTQWQLAQISDYKVISITL